jgi:hypothetical protein
LISFSLLSFDKLLSAVGAIRYEKEKRKYNNFSYSSELLKTLKRMNHMPLANTPWGYTLIKQQEIHVIII